MKIKELREERKISQTELSKISGVSRVTINEIENNKRPDVKTSTLAALASALDVPIPELY